MHEWLKLHTALRSSEIYKDINAKVVFMHLLIVADNQGNGRISRYMAASELGMNPNTFKSALQRCSKKYDLCTLSSTNKFSDFSLKNWNKYQSLDTSQTPARHQPDTSQTPLYKEEIKNKKKIISKDIGSGEPVAEVKPRENKKNPLIDHVLFEFKQTYTFEPTDGSVARQRQIAWNTVQRMRTIISEKLGGELTDDRVKTGITKFFRWLERNEGFDKIQKLETAKLKLNIWAATLKGKNATDERKDDPRASEQVTNPFSRGQEREILREDRSGDTGQDNVLHTDTSEATRVRDTGTFKGLGQLLPKVLDSESSKTIGVRPNGVAELRLGNPVQELGGGIKQTDGSSGQPTGRNL